MTLTAKPKKPFVDAAPESANDLKPVRNQRTLRLPKRINERLKAHLSGDYRTENAFICQAVERLLDHETKKPPTL